MGGIVLKLTFHGAAKTVTGSCHLLETNDVRIMVDCGMFQGSGEADELNYRPFPFDPSTVDYLLLTHAHIDHSGLIPRLVKEGFQGKIIATRATSDLCGIMLLDSAHIQEMEAEWETRKRKRFGAKEVEPLYTKADAAAALRFFQPIDYDSEIILGENAVVCFHFASHILGAAIIEITINEKGEKTKFVFSGDLGRKNQPIIRDPHRIEAADYLIIESTYGNRRHEDKKQKSKKLSDIILEAVENRGKIIIPAFAVGRTQDVLYELNLLAESGRIPRIPIYFDSPLAIEATQIFTRHRDNYDRQTTALLESGDDPFSFPGLHFARSADESKALNTLEGQAIIVSASGMCTAGRIKHHLKHNLWRPEASVLFIGYQAKGTLGRRLLDGEKEVKIFGEDISVQAKIYSIDGFSAHADRDDLLQWIGQFVKKPKKVFVVHGEEEAAASFAAAVNEEFGLDTVVPDRSDCFRIQGTAIEKTAVVSLPPDEFDNTAVRELVDDLEVYARQLSSRLRKISAGEDPLTLDGKNIARWLRETAAKFERKTGANNKTK
jgi:metallo-beta-lactamase family protein